tara:strand:- start:73942 stop:75174 length:1233 start_codon:yes stop_codon:yes gene_type:complete
MKEEYLKTYEGFGDFLRNLENKFKYSMFKISRLKEKDIPEKYIDELIYIRDKARNNELWELSDKIRDYLDSKGSIVYDTKDGQEVYHGQENRKSSDKKIADDKRSNKRFDAWLYTQQQSNNIKTYEGFRDLFNKKEKLDKNDWEACLEWIYNNYKTDKMKFLSAEHSDHSCTISWVIGNEMYGFYCHQISKYGKEDDYSITYGSLDIKDWPKLTKKQYDKYRKYIIDISDYLDDRENISGSTIDDILNTSKEEVDGMKAMSDLKKYINEYLSSYIGKSFTFESKYYLWTSDSENTTIVEDIEIDILGIHDIYVQTKMILFKCNFKGFDMILTIQSDSYDTYQDLNKIGLREQSKLADLSHDESKLTRKQKREKTIYPMFISMDVIPSEYKSMEFVKACKEFLNQIPDVKE